jgi:hypothetical protein
MTMNFISVVNVLSHKPSNSHTPKFFRRPGSIIIIITDRHNTEIRHAKRHSIYRKNTEATAATKERRQSRDCPSIHHPYISSKACRVLPSVGVSRPTHQASKIVSQQTEGTYFHPLEYTSTHQRPSISGASTTATTTAAAAEQTSSPSSTTTTTHRTHFFSSFLVSPEKEKVTAAAAAAAATRNTE